ncbi:DUF3775 domain-containing protein [Terricaulis sp.]|uniref:DUF3775 domain-containing protein n=1 Tax=Terricaulis sp. TaxID=2768686 RepID=UPI0037841A48
MTVRREIPEPPESFVLDRETLAYIVLKAKAFDMLTPSDSEDDASDAADDRFVDAIEDEADNPAARELKVAIASLDVDAKASLVALTWLGRGDYEASDWTEALAAARERAQGPTSRYLMGIPLLGDYLEDGAEKLGVDLIAEEEIGLGDPDLDTRGG